MANTENIEAKLCAYVDGELDAAGRAEIEAHLAANPQHRQLMEELMGQRNLLRELPRVAAPADLLETVNSQLERSALLDVGRGPDIAGRISPWPRIMSVAAVLTMAIGLFAVIYYVLPMNSANRRSPQYATDVSRAPSAAATNRSLSAATTPTETLADATEHDKDRIASAKSAVSGDAGRKFAEPGVATGSPATRADVFAKDSAIQLSGEAAPSPYTNIFADVQTEEALKRSNAVPSDSLVMVVASADLSQAQGEVQRYLQDNKIRWENVSEPVPQMEFKESQVLSGSRLGQTNMRLKGGPPTEQYAAKGGGSAGLDLRPQQEKQAMQKSVDSKKAESAEPMQQQLAHAPGAAAGPPPNPNTPNIASNAAAPQVYDFGAATAPAQQPQHAQAEQSQPAQQAAPSAPQSAPSAEQLTLEAQPQAQVRQEQQLQQAAVSNGSNAGNAPQVIVARGLTRRQVSELNSNLATQNDGRVRYLRRSGDNFTPTTLPTTPAAQASTIAPTGATTFSATTQPQEPRREMAIQDKAKAIDDLAGDDASTRPTTLAINQKLDTAALKKQDRPAAPAVTQPAPAAAPVTMPATPRQMLETAALRAATHPTTAWGDRLDVVICIQPPAPASNIGAVQTAAPNAAVAAPAPATPAPAPVLSPASSQPAATPNAAATSTAPAETSDSVVPNDTPPTDTPPSQSQQQ